MRIPSPALTAAMKRMNRDNLRSVAIVQSEMTVPAPGGGSKAVWANRLPDPLPCRRSALTAQDQEKLVASKVEASRACPLIFEAGADVKLTDRFIVTSEDGSIEILYPIGGTFPRDGEIMRKVLCESRS